MPATGHTTPAPQHPEQPPQYPEQPQPDTRAELGTATVSERRYGAGRWNNVTSTDVNLTTRHAIDTRAPLYVTVLVQSV